MSLAASEGAFCNSCKHSEMSTSGIRIPERTRISCASARSSPVVLRFRMIKTMRCLLLLLIPGLALQGMSCQSQSTNPIRQPGKIIYYDAEACQTAYTKLQEDGLPPLVQSMYQMQAEMHNRYHKSLARPVALIDFGKTTSKWSLFYATNRLPDSVRENGGLQFGNDLRKAPLYGHCELRVPNRQRAVDPKMKPKENSRFLPVSFSDSKPDEPVVEFDQVNTLSENDFLTSLTRQLKESPEKDLLIFVHGFNVSFDQAIVRTAQLAWDIPFNGAICSYSWPSQGGVTNYGKDETVNEQSTAAFTKFLKLIINGVPSQTRINIVVHSMGNRLVMRSLNELPRYDEKPFQNVVLCSPDVGITNFAKWIPGVYNQSKQVTMYTSTEDMALGSSTALHNEYRAGNNPEPIALPHITTIECSNADFSFMEHSFYGSNLDVVGDLFRVLKEDAPPEERHYLTRKQGTLGFDYWEFDGQPYELRAAWVKGPANQPLTP